MPEIPLSNMHDKRKNAIVKYYICVCRQELNIELRVFLSDSAQCSSLKMTGLWS